MENRYDYFTNLHNKTRVKTYVSLLNWYTNKGILGQIVTCNINSILYNDRKQKMQYPIVPLVKLATKKVMVTGDLFMMILL